MDSGLLVKKKKEKKKEGKRNPRSFEIFHFTPLIRFISLRMLGYHKEDQEGFW